MTHSQGSLRWRKAVKSPSRAEVKAVAGLKKRNLHLVESFWEVEQARELADSLQVDGWVVEVMPYYDAEERYDTMQYEVWAKRVKRPRR